MPRVTISAHRAVAVHSRAHTSGGAASLVQQLRPNTTLVHFGIGGPSEPSRELTDGIRGALRWCNLTLRSFRAVCVARHRSIPRYLRRNMRIRQALERLPTYRVAPTSIWPLVLDMVSDLPTLLYRFLSLQKSDISALVEHLPQGKVDKKGGGRAKKWIRKAS